MTDLTTLQGVDTGTTTPKTGILTSGNSATDTSPDTYPFINPTGGVVSTTASSPVGSTVGPGGQIISGSQFGNLKNINYTVGPGQGAYIDPNSGTIQNNIAGMQGGVGLNYNPNAGTYNAKTNTYNGASIAPLMMLGGPGSTDQTNQNAQQSYINNLNQIATGQGPSVAEQEAKAQGQAATAGEMAAIAGGGGNPALAMRNASNAAAANRANVAYNATIGKASEALGAQATLGTALGTTRQEAQALPLANQAASVTTNNTQAQLNQQTTLQNIQNKAAQGVALTQQENAMLNASMSQNSYDIAQGQNYQNAYQQYQSNMAALAGGQGIAQMQETGQIIGSAAGGVGAAGAAGITAAASPSDKRLKTNIKSAARDINAFLTKFAPTVERVRYV